jgi:hypothetical protein
VFFIYKLLIYVLFLISCWLRKSKSQAFFMVTTFGVPDIEWKGTRVGAKEEHHLPLTPIYCGGVQSRSITETG